MQLANVFSLLCVGVVGTAGISPNLAEKKQKKIKKLEYFFFSFVYLFNILTFLNDEVICLRLFGYDYFFFLVLLTNLTPFYGIQISFHTLILRTKKHKSANR